MEQLVSRYKEIIDFDSNEQKLNVHVYENKYKFIDDYIRNNLMYLKISEPMSGEKYEQTFKKYLEELKSLTDSYRDDELVIVGVYGYNSNCIDTNTNDVNLYHMDEIDLLFEDMKDLYQ